MAKKILVTGTAGFIGFHLAEALLKRGDTVIGIDNINDYYNVTLKYARLKESGIDGSQINWNSKVKSIKYSNYHFIRMNLEHKEALIDLCKTENFDIIVNLAAQAGVRYSIENPDVYAQSNIVGFLNILEAARYCNIEHLVYASSSSVYGMNENIPFSVKHSVDHPVSLYAATKKSNELMAHAYSHLYNIPTTGLRFFTVYGPWGRPDMAYFLFAEAITNNLPIKLFNHGKLQRDFTYIDDIISGTLSIIDNPPRSDKKNKSVSGSSSNVPYHIYNLGNNKPVMLMDFVSEIEKNIGKKAILHKVDMQPGDVYATWADIDELINDFDYRPNTTIDVGIGLFIEWYKSYKNSFYLHT